MFLAKFIFKLYMHGSDRTVVVKIPLIRKVMPKRDLVVFLRSRDEQRSSRISGALTSRRSAGRSLSADETTGRTAKPPEGARNGAPGGISEVPPTPPPHTHTKHVTRRPL